MDLLIILPILKQSRNLREKYISTNNKSDRCRTLRKTYLPRYMSLTSGALHKVFNNGAGCLTFEVY